MWTTSSATTLYAVIGDPIRQSRSPFMHNAAFQSLHVDAIYTAFQVGAHQLEQAIQGIRALGIGGVNVTIPHKERVIAYLDQVDESAQVIGAVNTIVNRDGKLIGYNTDGLGYVRSLQAEDISLLAETRILIIGAGGAARGIAYALLKAGCQQIVIANRTLARAQALAADLAPYGLIRVVPLFKMPSIDAGQVDIIIHATSTGMYPDVTAIPIHPDWLQSTLMVSDIVYNPCQTALLQAAQRTGCRTHSGLGMFVYQGAIAFELWTGKPAPIKVMKQVVSSTLFSNR